MLRSLEDSVLVDYRGREGTEVCELRPGEQIVVSPLTKPVVGMEVRLRETRLAEAESRPPADTSDSVPHPKRGWATPVAVLGQLEPVGGGG